MCTKCLGLLGVNKFQKCQTQIGSGVYKVCVHERNLRDVFVLACSKHMMSSLY